MHNKRGAASHSCHSLGVPLKARSFMSPHGPETQINESGNVEWSQWLNPIWATLTRPELPPEECPILCWERSVKWTSGMHMIRPRWHLDECHRTRKRRGILAWFGGGEGGVDRSQRAMEAFYRTRTGRGTGTDRPSPRLASHGSDTPSATRNTRSRRTAPAPS